MKCACLLVLIAVALMAGCDSDSDEPGPSPPRRAAIVSVGRPVTPRPVSVLGPGWVEMRARSPAPDGRPTYRVVAMRPPPGRPRDTCLTVGRAAQDLAEDDTSCDVSAPGAGAVSFVAPAFGGGPASISGVATGVRAVRVEGLGGTHTLPLSAHRAFIALYAARAHGKVRLVSQLEDHREIVRTFELPVPERVYGHPHHEHRRPGAVFNDEIGEPITQLSYRQVVHRFGPPAVVRREHGFRCAYYEVVGYANDGWQFCFGSGGKMRGGAMGNVRVPKH